MVLNHKLTRVIGRNPHLRRIADVVCPGPGREQFVEWFKRQFPLTRWKYRENDAWSAAERVLHTVMDDSVDGESMVEQVLATMKRPTVGELKRALATDDCSRFRRRVMDECARKPWPKQPIEEQTPSVKLQFDAYLRGLRSMSDDRLVPALPHRNDIIGAMPVEEGVDKIVAMWLVQVAWVAELATQAEAEVQARWDAALPPPAPAAPSTRGRF